jgi:hypothetical protein
MLTSIPLWFLCLFYEHANAPGASEMPQGDFSTNKKVLPPKRVFGARAGCGNVTSLYKNLVKNQTTNFPRQAIQEPIFSVASVQILKAVAMGVVAACGTFLVR